jgi:hypothetical protein
MSSAMCVTYSASWLGSSMLGVPRVTAAPRMRLWPRSLAPGAQPAVERGADTAGRFQRFPRGAGRRGLRAGALTLGLQDVGATEIQGPLRCAVVLLLLIVLQCVAVACRARPGVSHSANAAAPAVQRGWLRNASGSVPAPGGHAAAARRGRRDHARCALGSGAGAASQAWRGRFVARRAEGLERGACCGGFCSARRLCSLGHVSLLASLGESGAMHAGSFHAANPPHASTIAQHSPPISAAPALVQPAATSTSPSTNTSSRRSGSGRASVLIAGRAPIRRRRCSTALLQPPSAPARALRCASSAAGRPPGSSPRAWPAPPPPRTAGARAGAGAGAQPPWRSRTSRRSPSASPWRSWMAAASTSPT